MNRISTAGSYLSVIANLNEAQARQIQAGSEVSSQKKADDLKGYARSAETLTAMQATFSYQLLTRAVGDRYGLISTAIGGM